LQSQRRPVKGKWSQLFIWERFYADLICDSFYSIVT